MRQHCFYPVVFILFWVGLFIYGVISMGYKSDSSLDDDVPNLEAFDDVRSGIVGALTNDDVMETSDDAILHKDEQPHSHVGLDSTTRAEFEFENTVSNDVDLSLNNFVESVNEVAMANASFPHGDLKLEQSEELGLHNKEFGIQNSEQVYTGNEMVNVPPEAKDNIGAKTYNDDSLESVAQMGEGALHFEVGRLSNQEPNPALGLGVPNVVIHDNEASLKLDDANHMQGEFHQPVVFDPGRFSMQVTNHMIDHFQVNLPPLLEGYKNPCWLEQVPEDFTYEDSYFNTCNVQMNTGEVRYQGRFETFQREVLNKRAKFGAHWRVRCFPYFFLLGVGKCGTTDLFLTLKTYAKHLAPSFLKEPHFWEWKRCHPKMHCHGRPRNPTFAEYLDALDPPSERIRQEKTMLPNGTEYHPLIIGDFTPSSLTFYPCWSHQAGNIGQTEPVYLTPHYIHSIRPQTKFIVSLRDPVERIFSNYKMKFRLTNHQGDENARMFHQEMLAAVNNLTTCMQTNTPRACAFTIMRFDSMTHVSNSMYEIFISDWLKIFPRDQFLFIRMEDYMENRVPHVNAILTFLGQEPLNPVEEQEVASKQVSNKAPEAEGMFPETKQMLQNFFRPFNMRLAVLLNHQGFTWGY